MKRIISRNIHKFLNNSIQKGFTTNIKRYYSSNKTDSNFLEGIKVIQPDLHNVNDKTNTYNITKDNHNLNSNKFNNPKISIGGDFKDLVTDGTVFVDKSMFIKEIFEDTAKAILITMPRRWGKSLNLDMLKRFLSVQVDSEGNTINPKDTDNHKLFAGGKIEVQNGFSKNQKTIPISKLVQQNSNALEVQGTYPVIHIDFKDCKGSSVDEIKGKLRDTLYETVAKFSYLKHSEKEYDLSTIKDTYLKLAKDIESGKFEHALKTLSALLHSHHGKKVWILIDEYDAGANKAYLEFNDYDQAKAVSELFRSIYEPALKGNESLEKGIMTGVQYIVQSGMLSGLNNLSKYNVTSPKYSQYYGINQEEMDYLLSSFEINEERAKEIKNWYNGYKEQQIGQDGQYNSEYIDKYNIWSVINYLNNQTEFKSFWENSGSIDEFMTHIVQNKTAKQTLENLVNGAEYDIGEPTTDFKLQDFKQLKNIKENTNISELTNYGQDLFWSYLFITGYLTSTNEGLSLPNKEIAKEVSKYLKIYYEKELNIDPTKFTDVTITLSKVFKESDNNEIKMLFEKNFAEQFRNIIKSVDTEKVFGNEDMVHSLLNNIAIQVVNAKFSTERYTTLQDVNNECLYDENGKVKKGRADIVLSKNDKGIAIEMKYQKDLPKNDSEQLARDKAKEALEQSKTYSKLIENDPLKIFVGCNVTENQEVYLSGSIEQEGQDSINFQYPPEQG